MAGLLEMSQYEACLREIVFWLVYKLWANSHSSGALVHLRAQSLVGGPGAKRAPFVKGSLKKSPQVFQ